MQLDKILSQPPNMKRRNGWREGSEINLKLMKITLKKEMKQHDDETILKALKKRRRRMDFG